MVFLNIPYGKTRQPALIFPTSIAHCHIFGGAHPGGYDPTFELGWDFCTVHLSPKFRHPMFTRLEVIMLTNKHANKQTPLKTSNALRYATTLGKYNERKTWSLHREMTTHERRCETCLV